MLDSAFIRLHGLPFCFRFYVAFSKSICNFGLNGLRRSSDRALPCMGFMRSWAVSEEGRAPLAAKQREFFSLLRDALALASVPRSLRSPTHLSLPLQSLRLATIWYSGTDRRTVVGYRDLDRTHSAGRTDGLRHSEVGVES